jgi:hypothetical protein
MPSPVSIANGNGAPRWGNKLTPEQYTEAVAAGNPDTGTTQTGREVLASAGAAKSIDSEVEAFQKASQVAWALSRPESVPPQSEAEFTARFWAAHEKAASLGYELKWEPRTGTVGAYYVGTNIRDTSGPLHAMERDLEFRAFKAGQTAQYEADVQAKTDRTNAAIKDAARKREFAENGHDVVSQLRAELASVKAELAALKDRPRSDEVIAPAASPVAPKMPPVEYAPGVPDDEPVAETDMGFYGTVKSGLSDLVAKYAGH